MSVAKASLYEHPLKVIYHFLKIDTALFMALIILCMSGLVVLYSASGGDIDAILKCIRTDVRNRLPFIGRLDRDFPARVCLAIRDLDLCAVNYRIGQNTVRAGIGIEQREK